MLGLSNCYAYTARFDKSTALAAEAARRLSVMNEPFSRRLATLAISTIIVDLSLAPAPPRLLAVCARSFLQLLQAAEHDSDPAWRATAYDYAAQSARMLIRTGEYRASAALEQLAARFRDIASRDPQGASSVHTLLDRVNELAAADGHQEILDQVLPQLRSAVTAPYDRYTLDALEAVARLWTGDYDAAFRGMDTLLGVEPTGTYLLLPLRSGMVKVLQAVLGVTRKPAAPAILRSYTRRLTNVSASLIGDWLPRSLHHENAHYLALQRRLDHQLGQHAAATRPPPVSCTPSVRACSTNSSNGAPHRVLHAPNQHPRHDQSHQSWWRISVQSHTIVLSPNSRLVSTILKRSIGRNVCPSP